MEESNPELESFRQKWREEVSARTKAEGNRPPPSSSSDSSKSSRRPPPAPRIANLKGLKTLVEEEYVEPPNFGGFDGPSGYGDVEAEGSSKTGGQEPRSALEHYEKAVERENLGNLGDSLDLYRKAFKMDHRVDLKYKNKHFPPSSFTSKTTNPNPSNTPVTVPNPAHHSLDGPPQNINQLIAGFSGLTITPAPPPVEGDPAPQCPLADMPDEILVHIFRDVAIIDVASFARLAQVCKKMAHLVATEEQIWKRVCLGSEIGFGAMHYQFQREISGGPIIEDYPELKENEDGEIELVEATIPLQGTITVALLGSLYSSSWRQMLRLRPRIRFNGCYISTNNYIRPGQPSPSQISWNSPVHIVTYYRYLRFFRDGTLISLLTTTEPADVVHHLTKPLLETHHNNANSHLPSAVMSYALRGRWRLSPVSEHPDVDLKDAEGDLCVETEGVGPKYMFRMDLSLRSAGKGAKNNKLVWQGFWSYNRITDDWAEFPRRNEKPLFWSRVRSYGMGA